MDHWTAEELDLENEQQLAALKVDVSSKIEKVVGDYEKKPKATTQKIRGRYGEAYSWAAAHHVVEFVTEQAAQWKADAKRKAEEATRPEDFQSLIAEALDDAGRWWDAGELKLVHQWIERRINPASIAVINAEMVRRHVGKIELCDIAAIAYIHRDSIQRQNGYSNHKRFIFNSGNDRKLVSVTLYDDHLTVILKVLEKIGFARKVAEKDRFNADPKKRSARYEMTADLSFPR